MYYGKIVVYAISKSYQMNAGSIWSDICEKDIINLFLFMLLYFPLPPMVHQLLMQNQ